MKIKYNLLFLPAIALLTACNINLNTPRNPANVKMRWSVAVCSSKAKTVTMFAGTRESDAENFAVWEQSDPKRTIDLPANVQALSKVYLKAVAADKNQVEMCVLYDGKAKKRIEFDDEEDAHINMTDSDNTDKCRCIE